MLNLLTDSLIRTNHPNTTERPATLPQTLHMLWTGQIDHFPAVRPHQNHAWHSFLVQLAFVALKSPETPRIPASPSEWRQLLKDLTPDYPADEPWHLIVHDITKPAFMQPPASDPTLTGKYRNTTETPDSLDILLKANKHDVKPAVASRAMPDDWLMALVTLQTMEGFTGHSSYGISRMNKGMGSRPALGLAPLNFNASTRFQRDLKALIEHFPTLTSAYPDYTTAGPSLLWVIPWDGEAEEQLEPSTLHPLYIEICRRIRLVTIGPNSIGAIRATSKKPRIHAESNAGLTGDPWAPINREDPKAPKLLTLSQYGMGFRQFCDLIASSEWERPIMTIPTKAERKADLPMELLFASLSRGQGKTHGFHTSRQPAPAPLIAALANPERLQEFHLIIKDRKNDLLSVKHAIQNAICVYLDQGKEIRNSRNLPFAQPWTEKLDDTVGPTFITQASLELEAHPDQREDIRLNWLTGSQQGVTDHAGRILAEALDNLPEDPVYKERNTTLALSAFNNAIGATKPRPGVQQNTQHSDKRYSRGTRLPQLSRSGTNLEPPDHAARHAASMAGYLAQLAQHRKGDFAELLHMDHESPTGPTFWRIMERYNLSKEDAETAQRWGFIIKGMALMTPRNSEKLKTNTAHSFNTPVGKALCAGPDNFRQTPVYTDLRLHQLLATQGTVLQELLLTAFRQLAGTGAAFNWQEMAQLILDDGIDHEASIDHRRRIAQDYYRTLRGGSV